MRMRIPLCLTLAALVVTSFVSTAAAQSSSTGSESSSEAESRSDDSSQSSSDKGSSAESKDQKTKSDMSAKKKQKEGADGTSKKPKSEHGSYEWKRSYGAGLEYGVFFSGLNRWNAHLLEPNNAGTFDVAGLSSFVIAIEASLLKGSRLTLFGGFETPFSSDPGILAAFGGLEPAFAFRRNSWELGLGVGVGVGNVSLTTGDDRDYNAGLVVLRPTIEVRRYFSKRFAGYVRAGFNQWLPFGGDSDSLQIARSNEQVARESLLQEGSVYAAVGARFGIYPKHVKTVPDTDGDGLRDDVDECPDKKEDKDGFEDMDGCPETDNDGDGVSDENDECPNKNEDEDGFEDDDGCPDTDNDGDGIADEKDECPDKPEDEDGYEDDDGCPDTDNDGDGTADKKDECPDEVGIPSNDGCPSEAVQIEKDRLVVKGAIDFRAPKEGDKPKEERPKTELTSKAEKTLDVVAEVLSVHPELATIEIQGHTGKGDEKKMKDLSQKRADAVRSYLVDAGVADKRLTAKGYGASKPTKPKGADSEKPTARIEFHIEKREKKESSKESSDE